ncbi:MAG: peptidylprolyl isomerase [Acidobacteria bacterium]|nr:peptidylprolyl isomerase [Acidobacteriota bacterium]
MRVFLLSMLAAALWAQTSAPKPAAAAAPKPAQTAKPAPAAKPAAAAAAKSAAPAASAADPVVFTAGSTRMTRSQFDNLMENLPDTIKSQLGPNSPEARRRFAEQLGDIVNFAEEARKLKLAEKPGPKVQIYLQQESGLAALYYQHLSETQKPTDADVAAWYTAHAAEFENAKARHILIRFKGSRVPIQPGKADLSEAEALAKAQAIRERIIKGEDFAAVAKAESDDTGSGAQGGDLGSFGRGRMVPAFEQAAFSLPVGEVSQPVKSAFGYHIIQVQERGAKPLAEVKDEITKQLTTENAQKAMKAFKETTKTTLDTTYFGAPQPPAAPAAAPGAPAAPAAPAAPQPKPAK